MSETYNLRITFLTGSLKGLTIDTDSPVALAVGKVYGPARTRYRVLSCKPI